MSSKREITRADLLSLPDYMKIRMAKRQEIITLKRNRRMEVGPFAALSFECWDTMWLQIQEMLYIEKGGEEQIAGELEAYNPMIPKGSELTATVMFQIDDPVRRKNALARLGGVEETAFIRFGGETIDGKPEEDQDRTNAAGKASSVQFLHFPFTAAQIALFRQPEQQVIVGFRHENYAHMAVMSESVRQALAADFD